MKTLNLAAQRADGRGTPERTEYLLESLLQKMQSMERELASLRAKEDLLLYRPDQAAQLLGISRRRVEELVVEGKLCPQKDLPTSRFSRAELERFVHATYAEEKANQIKNRINILDR